MTENDSQRNPYEAEPASQPPVQQVAPAPAADAGGTPTWAKVIGIISIVFGGLGVLCTPINLMNIRANPHVREMFGPQLVTAQTVSGLAGIVSAALLLAGGIYLLKRRRVGVTLHYVVAILNLVLIVANLVAMLTMAPGGRMGMLVTVPSILGTILGAAYPVFLLIWLSRPPVRADTANWR